jgi:hypothetical protein
LTGELPKLVYKKELCGSVVRGKQVIVTRAIRERTSEERMGIEVRGQLFGGAKVEEYKPRVYEKPPRRDPPPPPPHMPPPSPHTSMFPLFKYLKDRLKEDGGSGVK